MYKYLIQIVLKVGKSCDEYIGQKVTTTDPVRNTTQNFLPKDIKLAPNNDSNYGSNYIRLYLSVIPNTGVNSIQLEAIDSGKFLNKI
jgi:hypothetical protein